MSIQNNNNVFVFDMDNTLIKTDKANNLAYSKAISFVLGVNYSYDQNKRLTRHEIKNIFPELTIEQFDEIILKKEKYFGSFLKETELNQNLFKLLEHYHHENYHTILLTNSHAERAISLCNHYGITKYFLRRFFCEDCDGNKYSLLKSLGYDLKNIILYENEDLSKSEAINNGIISNNIFKIEF